MSTIIKFNNKYKSSDIVFVILDRTMQCQTAWACELMKNLSDYVLQDIVSKGYNVLQGIDEDVLLQEAALQYKFAVVISTGTEFINGNKFFKEVEKFVKDTDFFLMGHIPDRDDGYYELHDQCYLINLSTYKELNNLFVGGSIEH